MQIKSLMVSLNFIYTKKYLKEIIAGFVGQPSITKEREFKNRLKFLQPSGPCPLEEAGALKLIRDNLFKVIALGKAQGGATSPVQDSALLTYPDFRDMTEEMMYLFCSFAMSLNFTTDQICQYILPIGVSVL